MNNEQERESKAQGKPPCCVFVCRTSVWIYCVAQPGALGSVVVATEPMSGVITLTNLPSGRYMNAFCVDLKCSGKSMKSQLCSAVTMQRARRRLTFQPMEASPRRSPRGTTRLVKSRADQPAFENLLGVEQIYIGAHKMDCDTAGCKQERYDEISNEMRSMLIKVEWKKVCIARNTPVLPISGRMSDNLDFIAKNTP